MHRLIPLTLICVVLCAAVSQARGAPAAETEAQAAGDPEAMKEAQGWLKLDMRVDAGTLFVYPGIWEEENLKKATGIVLYGAEGDVTSVNIVIKDKNSNAVWQKDLDEAPKWKDTKFRTRTNCGTDANGNSNLRMDRYKFLDPNSSPFTAALLIQTPKGPLTATLSFRARARRVFLTQRDMVNSDLGYSKAIMWKFFGLASGPEAQDVVGDPAENSPDLHISGAAVTTASAFNALTPRGNLWTHGHGGLSQIRLDGTDRSGFKGQASNVGTKLPGDFQPFDGTECFQQHFANVDLLHCRTGARKDPETTFSVGESYKYSCDETIAQGTTVKAYLGILQITMGNFSREISGYTATDLTDDEVNELTGYAKDNLDQQATSMGAMEGGAIASPTWVGSHTICNVNPELNKQTMETAAKQQFDAAHPNHPPYSYTVDDYDCSYLVDWASVDTNSTTLTVQ